MLQRAAPPLRVTRWFNAPQALTLDGLRGKVVMLHAFQMRCPGCVEFATPQAQRVHDFFPRSDLIVIGLHSVFENHSTMSADALGAHIAETKLTFPIAVDEPDGNDGIPLTMRAYAFDGTPSVVLIDRAGFIRMKRLGHVPDLELGASIATLVAERGQTPVD
jgi:hypothetical protein